MTTKEKKRGRPRGFDKEKAEALAMMLFWKNGYEATGLSKLTDSIGVSAPSFYAAFGSKAGLLKRTIDLYQDSCAPFFKPAFETTNITDFTTTLLRGAVENYTQEGCGKGCLVLDGTRNATDPDALTITRQIREGFHKLMIEKFIELGASDSKKMADTCQTAMIGLSGAARHGLTRKRLFESAQLLAQGISEE